jgi:anti-sigma regulatory factor (Ser/Thr protein kinase)
MSLIGIISSDSDLNERILTEFNTKKDIYQLRVNDDNEKTLQFLNFGLPEIVIANLSDSSLNLNYIFDNVKNDAWLHNFGIVGLYNKDKHNERGLQKGLKHLNILTLMDYSKINSHLLKNVEIIENNKQIIYQMDIMDKLVERITGSFVIENDPLAGPVFGGLAANILSHRGYIDVETKNNLQIGLSELIINAIEHGNCKISFKEKNDFLLKGGNIIDLIAEKCKDPKIASKKVYFEWDIQPEETKFTIRDEGNGFNVKVFQKSLKKRNNDALHGRGILIARLFANKLTYNNRGNKVSLTVKHSTPIQRKPPLGFEKEEILEPKVQDIIFQQGEPSDFLYYISSGRYSVLYDSSQVGTLTPVDIFMGEMSFLLNNQRSATVRAETSGKLIKISRKAFVSIIKSYPHYGIFLSKLIARKLVRANTRSAYVQKRDGNLKIPEEIII